MKSLLNLTISVDVTSEILNDIKDNVDTKPDGVANVNVDRESIKDRLLKWNKLIKYEEVIMWTAIARTSYNCRYIIKA